jgi:hypothetical protein
MLQAWLTQFMHEHRHEIDLAGGIVIQRHELPGKYGQQQPRQSVVDDSTDTIVHSPSHYLLLSRFVAVVVLQKSYKFDGVSIPSILWLTVSLKHFLEVGRAELRTGRAHSGMLCFPIPFHIGFIFKENRSFFFLPKTSRDCCAYRPPLAYGLPRGMAWSIYYLSNLKRGVLDFKALSSCLGDYQWLAVTFSIPEFGVRHDSPCSSW